MFEPLAPPKARLAPLAGVLIGAAGVITFFTLFYLRYYRWRDCFNELGRCYSPDGSGEVYTTAGLVWGWVSVPFLVLTCVCAFALIRRRVR